MDVQMTPRSTPAQREHILQLMRRQELSTRNLTLMHRLPFARAGLGEPPVDKPVDAFLFGLTRNQASRLIDALKDMEDV